MLLNLILAHFFSFSSSLNLHVGLEYVWRYSLTDCSIYSPCGIKPDPNYVIRAKVLYEIPLSDTDSYADGDYLIETQVSDTVGDFLCKDYGTINKLNGDVYLGEMCGVKFPLFNDFHFENHGFLGYQYGVNAYSTESSAFGVHVHRYFSGDKSNEISSAKDSLFAIESVGLVYYRDEKSSRISRYSLFVELVSYDGIRFRSGGTGLRMRPVNGGRNSEGGKIRVLPNGKIDLNGLQGARSLSVSIQSGERGYSSTLSR